ncbi:acyl-CoA dehydrogenase family protein [Pseudonocardia yunnanensis]|uniref:acyl-CoA dehydrogenase family protein n=1 Tax=Pseudonocardia yunnanensis TaxID=58107 RepID=UPI0031E01981
MYRSTNDRRLLVSRAECLRPLLAQNARQGAVDRRLPEASIMALAEAGLFKLRMPKRYGGHEADLRTQIDVSAAIAYGDGAPGWVVGLANTCAWIVGLYSVRAQDDVFGVDPEVRICGSSASRGTAVTVEGGVRLSGRWSYVSGCLHAHWAVLGFDLVDEAGAVIEAALALVPAVDYVVSDTWFTAGMRASGSNTLSAEDVFVPQHRVVSRARLAAGNYPTERKDEIVYRASWAPTLTVSLIGSLLGLGRAALDHVRDAAGTKEMAATVFNRQADSAGFQMQLADAALRIESAYLHACRAAEDIDEHAARGELPDLSARARARADASRAAVLVVEAITILLNAHGSGGLAESSALQRIWQDVNNAARHASLLPAISLEIYGKALLGLENDIALNV